MDVSVPGFGRSPVGTMPEVGKILGRSMGNRIFGYSGNNAERMGN